MVWPHVTLAAMAARQVRRPVRLTVTRGQMFSSCGHREEQEQHIWLGATRDGKLTAIRHRKISVTSPFDDWAGPAFGVASRLYASPAIVATSTQEFGTGTPTVLTQVAADALGVELRDVRVEFGDTSLPGTGSPVGSNGAMMISAAVHNAGVAVRDQLIALAAADPASPLHGADPATITAASGRLMLSGDPGTGETYAALMTPAPDDRRRGHRQLGPAAARHPVRAADLRRPVREGRRRRRPRHHPGPAPGRRVRSRPDPQPPDRPQPAHGRHAVGNEPGPARRQPHGHRPRRLGRHQPG